MEQTRVRLPRSRTMLPDIQAEPSTRPSYRHSYPSSVEPPAAPLLQRRNHFRMNADPNMSTTGKPVYKLFCNHCSIPICARGMKAILLADAATELYSTDTPSQGIYVLEKDYLTRSCFCRIRDVACLECGNIIGYHVVSPCIQCLESSNNGHFWMFHSNACGAKERVDSHKNILHWNKLPRADRDFEFLAGPRIPYEQLCR